MYVYTCTNHPAPRGEVAFPSASVVVALSKNRARHVLRDRLTEQGCVVEDAMDLELRELCAATPQTAEQVIVLQNGVQ